MRCHAYLIRSERYYDLEERLAGMLPVAPRDQVLALLGEQHILDKIELFSGEWRLLFGINDEYEPVVDGERRRARMMVAPDRLQGLASGLWRSLIRDRWKAITFGLTTLTLALPLASGLVGVVIVEEGDEWVYAPPLNEMSAIHPSVFELLEGHLRGGLSGDPVALARLASDHAASIVEFPQSKWLALLQVCQSKAPEVAAALGRRLVLPGEYGAVITTLQKIIDPQQQPSLDSWLRVHGTRGTYALYFRDSRNERAQKPVISKAS
ncbi:MAG: hypothetical protein R3B09_12450 [Nannocystaceae bacterium]